MMFRGGPDDANQQAADWLARLHADDRGQEDETAFRAWLRADRRHAVAFERASAVWESAGGLRNQLAGQPRTVSRRAVLAGGAVAIIAGGTTLGWREATAGAYETAIGEQRRLVLEDGTRVVLDTATRIRFRARADARALWLGAGRIDLDIAADPRPFVIDVGLRRARAQTGRVDIRRDGGRIALTALEGVARVEGEGGSVLLASGKRIAMAEGQADRLDQPELDDVIAWQSGRLAFRDETLGQAIAEMNRYSRRPLVASGPAVAELRLSGMYRVGNPEAFARSLTVLLPVRVDMAPDAIRISAAD